MLFGRHYTAWEGDGGASPLVKASCNRLLQGIPAPGRHEVDHDAFNPRGDTHRLLIGEYTQRCFDFVAS